MLLVCKRRPGNLSLGIGLGPTKLGGLSGFSPSQVAGLTIWLKADAGAFQDAAFTTPAVANNDPVGGWQDQSGNANHVTQAVGSKRPIIETNSKNGLPSVKSDGIDDYMKAGAFTLNKPVTVFLGIKRTAIVDNYVFDGDTIDHMAVYGDMGNGHANTMYSGANGPFQAATTSWEIWSLVFNGASSKFRVNGGADATGNAGNSNPGGLTLFAAGNNGAATASRLVELCLYSGVLAAGDRDLVDAYLNARMAVY